MYLLFYYFYMILLTIKYLFSALATNMCYNVFDGLFNSRVDLVDAPACSLARGASVLGLGKNYINLHLYVVVFLLYIWSFSQ